ncbi:MAG: pitrilysin family protein [Candidatus Omnitrophica bacterium]|nr:pitrilysin family protein [Candidatus Omnitrophota bacterium]
MISKTVLKNGVRIVTHSAKDAQSLAVGIWVSTGSRNEIPEYLGISHYLEHLVFKGTKNYSCQQIKESIEGKGGSINAFTGEEATCYLVKLPAKYLDLAMDILSDMVLNPLFPEVEIEKERTVILEEIKMYKDLPQSYVYELLDELLWPEQPLGRSILGTVESVNRIKRADLDGYRRRYYTAPNIVVSAAGLFDHAKFAKIAAGKFSGLKEASPNIFAPAYIEQSETQANIFPKETEQTHFVLGFHGFCRDHKLKYALGLLNVILGGNSSSRLFEEIREKRGLAYEIGTGVKRLKDTGAFVVHAGVDNNKVIEVLKLIFAQLRRAKAEIVGRSEFTRAKEFYLGQLMLALEDSMDQMLWIGESTTSLDKTYTLKQVVQEVNKVKIGELQEAAKLIFKKENLNLALIGPLKASEEHIKKEINFE